MVDRHGCHHKATDKFQADDTRHASLTSRRTKATAGQTNPYDTTYRDPDGTLLRWRARLSAPASRARKVSTVSRATGVFGRDDISNRCRENLFGTGYKITVSAPLSSTPMRSYYAEMQNEHQADELAQPARQKV